MLNKILEQIRQLPEDQFIELIEELEKGESEMKKILSMSLNAMIITKCMED